LLGALIVIGALYNHYLGHSVLLFEIIMLAIGSSLAIYSLRGLGAETKESAGKGLLTAFLSRFLREKDLPVLVPAFGFTLLLAWSAWKILHNHDTGLTMVDFIVTLFCVSLMLYYSHTTKYQTQKDFAVLYLMFLTIVFAVIWKSYTLMTGDSYVRITAYSEFYFVTTPVVYLVNLLGLEAHAVLDLSGLGLSNIIEFEYDGRLIRLGIGIGCSGLYSAGLFFSAFLSFVLVRYRAVNRYSVTGLAVGLLVTWASNIIRMVVTILIGGTWGAPALATFHMYFGILLFIAVTVVFWLLIVRWLDKHIHTPDLPGGPGGTEVLDEKTAAADF
jgi:exosortase/archaeosortase family protein